MTGSNRLPPQDQLLVVLGLQYAVLAKCVKGENAFISADDNAVIVCRFESSTGLALTATKAKREAKNAREVNMVVERVCGWQTEVS